MANSHDFFLPLNPLLTRLMVRAYSIFIFLFASHSIFSEDIGSIYNRSRSFIETEEWDSSIYYANICLIEALESDDIDFQIKSRFVIAYSLSSKREFGNSVIEYLKAAELAEFSDRPSHKKMLTGLYKNISQITHKYRHYDLTKIYIDKALKLAYERNDTFQIVSNSQNLINLLIDEDKFSEATEIIEKTLSFTADNPDAKSHLLNNLGRLKIENREFEAARILYKSVFSSENKSEIHKPVAHLNFAWSYIHEDRYKEAIPLLLKTSQICKNTSDNNWLFTSHKLLGNCFEKLNSTDQAEYHYFKAISILHLPEVNTKAYEVYEEVSNFYLSLGEELNALKYKNLYASELEKHIKEQEDILIQDKKYNMQLLTERYFDNLERRELAQRANFQTRLTILISSGIIVLVILGFYYRQKRMRLAIVRALAAIERTSKV